MCVLFICCRVFLFFFFIFLFCISFVVVFCFSFPIILFLFWIFFFYAYNFLFISSFFSSFTLRSLEVSRVNVFKSTHIYTVNELKKKTTIINEIFLYLSVIGFRCSRGSLLHFFFHFSFSFFFIFVFGFLLMRCLFLYSFYFTYKFHSNFGRLNEDEDGDDDESEGILFADIYQNDKSYVRTKYLLFFFLFQNNFYFFQTNFSVSFEFESYERM